MQRTVAFADRLDGTLRTAEALAHTSRRIDLAGLDEQVARLCAGALLVPAEHAGTARTRLEALLGRIDALLAALAAGHAMAVKS